MYKLKTKNGEVKALLKTGNDYVGTTMKTEDAQAIIAKATITESDREDYPICTDSGWYFEGAKTKEKAEEVDE